METPTLLLVVWKLLTLPVGAAVNILLAGHTKIWKNKGAAALLDRHTGAKKVDNAVQCMLASIGVAKGTGLLNCCLL